jgi:arylsulfatase
MGDWKLLWLGGVYGDSRWGLYNLAEDPAERMDLSLQKPEKLEELLHHWDTYAREKGVILPTRDTSYASEKANR